MDHPSAKAGPPYPGHGAGPETLKTALADLEAWLRMEHPRLAVRGVPLPSLPPPPPISARRAYHQPVPDMFRHFAALRKIREAWDHLIRLHQPTWDGPDALRDRGVVVALATHLLTEAFVPFEQREARAPREAENLRRLIDTMLSHAAAAEKTYHGTEEDDPGASQEGQA